MLKIKLVAARVNAGYSINQVAQIMNKSKSTIINWEKDKSSIKADDFDKLCQLYNIPKDFVIVPKTLLNVEKGGEDNE